MTTYILFALIILLVNVIMSVPIWLALAFILINQYKANQADSQYTPVMFPIERGRLPFEKPEEPKKDVPGHGTFI